VSDLKKIHGAHRIPPVLDNMAKNLTWNSSLGEAYHNQQSEVMTAIQTLRAQAKAKGNLKTTSQITVVQQSPQAIVILHARLHHGVRRIPQHKSKSHAQRTGVRRFWKPVPLPGLRQDSHRADARRGKYAEGQQSKNEPSYADFLDELLKCEVEARRTRYLRARLQLAHFPFVKTFEQFDFGFQPSLDDRQIRELRSLRFIHEASNVIFLGPPGVGKTHLSVALAEEAIRSGLGAYFITAHDLAADLGRAYREGRLDRRMRVYLAPKVLAIDEVGYLPLDDLGATIFFQLVSARYERGSIILTSNKSYGDWGSIFGDSILATAILDRLLHHSTTINIRGESYWLKDRHKAGLVPPRGQEGAEATARSLASDSVTPETRQKTALGSTPSEAKEAHS
jgi:DNA replication protein DnaC